MKCSVIVCALAALACSAQAQILTLHNDSLTTYQPSGASAIQDIRPLPLARGVGIDGSQRAGSVQRWALAGNPFGDHAPATAKIGDVNLATGAYMITDIDVSLPAAVPIVIGRSFNGRQETSGAAHRDSNGPQGYNWFQMSQPAIVFYDGSPDMMYIVYGADRFLEFKRFESSTEYVGTNGCAGVVQFVEHDPEDGSSVDTFIYYDQNGNRTYFFGSHNGGAAAWQFWKTVDTAGNTAYVGHASTPATAISSGYTADGGISKAYDSAGRRFCYTYSSSTIGGVKRLEQVLVETDAGGGWGNCGTETTVAKVDYTYYSSDVSGEGKTGDLKLVKVTMPLTDSGVSQELETYYRYYTASYSNSDGLRGEPHQIKLVVGPEGCRSFDYGEDGAESPPVLDDGFLGATDSVLKPFADAFLEYTDTGGSFPYRVYKSFFNGECGCGGGASTGTTEFAYGTNGSFSAVSGYDDEWKERVVVKQPDNFYATQYFDECGQPISRVVTDADPSGSPTKTWCTEVVRDSTSGCVTANHTPKNITAYTHSTGSFTRSTSVGLVHVFGRVTGGGTLNHFPESVKYKEGTGPAYFTSWTNYASRGLVVGSATDYRPMLNSRRSYHTATDDHTTANTYDTTSMSYSWWSGTNSNVLYVTLKQVTTTNPTVTTLKNGSNAATTSDRFLREDGTVAYSLAPDGIYTHMAFTNGQLTKRIDDVKTNTAGLSPDPNGSFGITETADGWHRVTEYSFDAQGRADTMTEPDGRVHKSYYSKIGDGRNVVINWPRLASATLYGPASYGIGNHAGGNDVSGLIAITSSGLTLASHPLTDWITESDADPITALDKGTLARMTVSIRSKSGARVDKSRVYFDIPASGAGTTSNYDETVFGYDDMGRRRREVDPTGTITRTTFDELGRVVSSYLGTNDADVGGTDDMVETSRNAYDGGSSGGNSNLTTRTMYVENSSTDQRVTTFDYDFRGRMLMVTNPLAPHTVNEYDNLSRITASAQYSSAVSASTNPDATGTQTYRVALHKSLYDELGRVYQSARYNIDQADGSDDDSVMGNMWRDAAGRTIKVQGSQFSKSVYDRLGRATHRFILAKSNDSAYADADDVAGDKVLEEHQTAYESANSDNVLMSVVLKEEHNVGSGTGALDANADGGTPSLLKLTFADLTARAQIASMWYDDIDRVTNMVQYGTYGDATYDRSTDTSPPTRSDTALRSTTTYNDDGTTLEVEAPGKPSAPTGTTGTKTRYEYDDLGRTTKVINNYADGTPGGGTHSDEDQTIKYEFTKGHMTKMIADLPSGSDQETLYIFGTTAGTPSANKVTTLNRLRAVKYPDSANAGTTQAYIDGTSDADVVSYAYNAQGQETLKKDQAGTVIETVYDTFGREVHRKATALGSGIDNAVERISTVYLSRGLPDTVSQYDDPSSGSVVDQVQYSYDGWGNLTTYTQDVDSAIGSSGRAAFNVGYTYAKATGGRQTVRRATMTGTSMNTVTYSYGAGSDVDDCASRVWGLSTSSVTVASYVYRGNMQTFTYLSQANVDTASRGYDRFDRVNKDYWYAGNADAYFFDMDIAYDRNGGIVSITDNPKTDGTNRQFDALYSNDDLGRLIRSWEGKLASGTISPQVRDETWMYNSASTLTQTGNWGRYRRNLNSGVDSDFTDANEMDDSRTHNIVNELTARDLDSTPGTTGNNYTLSHDAAGNMTGNTGDNYTLVYDAFGRLRTVTATTGGRGLISEYRYNGLGMKIGHHYDADGDNDTDANDPWYYTCYSERWQAVTVFRGSDTDAKERYIYHSAGLDGMGSASYIDDVVLRDRDANTAWTSAADSTKEERYYHLQNFRHDVVGVLTSGGKIVEQVKYSAYGVAFGLPSGDGNANGIYDVNDDNLVDGAPSYTVRLDFDLDGDVDAADKTHAASIKSGYHTTGYGVASASTVMNRRTYAGYEHAFELAGSKQHVRHRMLDSELGRWTRRDPIALLIRDIAMTQYNGSIPIPSVDPSGLATLSCNTPVERLWPPGNTPWDAWWPHGDGSYGLFEGGMTPWHDLTLHFRGQTAAGHAYAGADLEASAVIGFNSFCLPGTSWVGNCYPWQWNWGREGSEPGLLAHSNADWSIRCLQVGQAPQMLSSPNGSDADQSSDTYGTLATLITWRTRYLDLSSPGDCGVLVLDIDYWVGYMFTRVYTTGSGTGSISGGSGSWNFSGQLNWIGTTFGTGPIIKHGSSSVKWYCDCPVSSARR